MSIEEIEENILYELLVHVEWTLDPEIIGGELARQGGSIFYRLLTQAPNNLLSLTSRIGRHIFSNNATFNSLSRVIDNGSNWQLGVGAQGAVIIILQGSSLEIRAKKDEYASIVGRNINLYNDPFPKWRKVSWSPECSMVAVAYSDGTVEIFNTVGASLFTIYPRWYHEKRRYHDVSCALASLIFSDVRTQNIKWASELILIGFDGTIRSYFVSPTEGYQESHYFSFHHLYPHGITAAVDIGSLIIVAGDCKYVNDQSLRNNGLGHGLSLWRMIMDYPFYKQVPTIDEDEYIAPHLSLIQYLGFGESSTYDCIFRLCISPKGRHVAALHTSGSLSIWDVPSLRKKKFWLLPNQPGFDIQNSAFLKGAQKALKQMIVDEELSNNLVDVKWWSDIAVILARFSGAITICSISSLANLLGDSPEFFEGVPQISEANDSSFLGLEIEQHVLKSTHKSHTGYPGGEPPGFLGGENFPPGIEENEDEDDGISYYHKAKRFIKHTLYWITDSEKFQPKGKCPKLVSNSFRLLSLKSTTPQELFFRKIENEEYGEALALARRYSLDCDLVYQQQWHRSKVTVSSIQDYLHKIKKRWWVLDACLTRVPDDIDAARDLLLYGLRGTELDTLVAIANDEDSKNFIVSDLGLEYEEDFDLNPKEAERQAQAWAAENLRRRRELLSQIDFKSLSHEQIRVIQTRQLLLQYYDRLNTYEVLLGGHHASPDNYDADFYEKFRNRSETEAALHFAQNSNWKGVEVMFTYHGDKTLPHRLAILSNFSPTMAPFEYRDLLPECDLNGEVFEWEDDLLRDRDWCEDPICSSLSKSHETSIVESLYQDSDLKEFRQTEGEPLKGDIVSQWYKWRAKQIESTSHFIDSALDLLKLGSERNVLDLGDLQDIFECLDTLNYEVCVPKITLKKYEKLDIFERLKLFMSMSTPENQLESLQCCALPFLDKNEKRQPGIKKELLHKYIIWSSMDDLSLAFKIIQQAHKDTSNAILKEPQDLLRVALDSIYKCDKPTQLPRAFAMLEHLPTFKEDEERKELLDLQKEVDALEDHLIAAEILSNYGILVSPLHVWSIQEQEDKVTSLFIKLTRSTARKDKLLSESDWNTLLNDMLELQQKVFSVIEPQLCYEIVAEGLLTSGVQEYIEYAKSFLETKDDSSPVHNPYLEKVPFTSSLSLVLKASQEYFNASESYQDDEMELARICLGILECEDEEVSKELDLISSLYILPVMGIKRLPLQVRLCENRLILIEESLREHPENYQLGPRILQLAQMLRVCGDDIEERQAKVLSLLAEAAFKCGDEIAASSWCDELVSGCHKDGWRICAQLGQCGGFQNLKLRAKFLDFALTYADANLLESLLNARNQVELLWLCSKVRSEFETEDASPDSDDGFEDAEAFHTEDSEEFLDPEGELSGPLRLLDTPPFQMTKNVLSTTSSVVSSVANKKFWKNALGWMRPLRDVPKKSGPQSAKSEPSLSFESQGCHAFYSDVYPHDAQLSVLSPSYKSYAPPIVSNPSLEFSLNLLRISLLEETLSLGKTKQDNNSIIEELTKVLLKEDLSYGLSLLFLMKAPEDANKVLSFYPRTELSLQVSLYYFALRIYNLLYPWKNKGIAPVYLHDPSDVITCVSYLIESDSKLGKTDQELKNLIDHFQRTEHVTNDYIQGQALLKLGAGVDIERFLTDASYKEDTVLGLAMSSQGEVFSLAVTLAKKYDVPLWQVYITHFQYLFDSEDVSTEDLSTLVDERGIINVLSEDLPSMITTMKKSIFFSLNGSDYGRLMYYYKVISNLDKQESEIHNCHIRFLKQLQDAKIKVNYKELLQCKTSIIDTLKPVLNANNVSILAELAAGFSNLGETGASKYSNNSEADSGYLDSSKVYCAWAQKSFFQASPKNKLRMTSDWVSKFDHLQGNLAQMSAGDFEVFIKWLALSQEGRDRVPLDARREIVKKAISFSMAFSQTTSVDAESWRKTISQLERLGQHLDLLHTEIFKGLLASGPPLEQYAMQFASCGGDEDSLSHLARQVLWDLHPMETLRSLLAVYPEESSFFPEDVFTKALSDLLQQWATESSAVSECTSCAEVLLHLLKELRVYTDEGGDLLLEDDILLELREFAQDVQRPVKCRIDVLKAAQQYLTLDKEDARLIQILETGEIVEKAWHLPLKESGSESSVTTPTESSLSLDTDEVKTEEGRLLIFNSLFENICTFEQAKSLLDLLCLWPEFSQKLYEDSHTNPWVRSSARFIEVAVTEKERDEALQLISSLAINAIDRNQMNRDSSLYLAKEILSLPHPGRLKAAAKISFKSGCKDSISLILEELKKNTTIDPTEYDEELFQLTICSNSVSLIVSSALYGPLVAYLKGECGSEDLFSDAVAQLRASNHLLESASLESVRHPAPLSLKTISSFVRFFHKS